MTKHLLYLIGAPGVGKSTLVRELAGTQKPFELSECGLRMLRYPCGVVELGARREAFSGTDALGMSIAPVARTFVAGKSLCRTHPLVLAEGDRLASLSFLEAARSGGYHVTLCLLVASDADARRARRARELGAKPQNAAWVKGRFTKIENLWRSFDVARAGTRKVLLNGAHSPLALAEQLATLNPVARALFQAGHECPRDTDGDGDCGRHACPYCEGGAERVILERER